MLDRPRSTLAAAMLVVAAALILLAAQPIQAAPDDQTTPDDQAATEPQTPSYGLYPSPNERIGVGIVSSIGHVTDYNLTQLEMGWYSEWGWRLNPPHPNGMDCYFLIATRAQSYPPNWQALGQVIRNNPGAVWMVGNEQEAPFQEDRTPTEYAVIYHDVYTFVKNTDPTAQVAIGGVIQPTPLRLQWLDMALQEYQRLYGTPMPVDIWNTHMQILNEVSCDFDPGNCWGAEIPAGLTATVGITMSLPDNASYDLFVRLITDMRVWMNARGFRDKPLIISEYGVLLPSDYLCDTCSDNKALGDAIVASFMTRTFEFMLNAVDPDIGYPADGNRLVQRWLWYSLNEKPYNMETGEGFNGSLFDYRNPVYPGTLTYFGQVFKNYVAPLKRAYWDLVPSSLRAGPSACGTYMVSAQVSNLGNTTRNNIKVRLYAGDPAAGGVQVGSDIVISTLGIRYATPATVRFNIPVPSGKSAQTYYVVVDPGQEIAESDETNNTASIAVTFAPLPNCVMLPVIVSSY